MLRSTVKSPRVIAIPIVIRGNRLCDRLHGVEVTAAIERMELGAEIVVLAVRILILGALLLGGFAVNLAIVTSV